MELIYENKYRKEDEELYIKTYCYIQGFSSGRNYINTLKALPLAEEFHAGQYRKGKVIVDNKLVRLPYVVHVLKVCNTLMNLKLPLNEHELDILYASALLHDIIEDCKDKLPKGGIELVKDNGLDTEILEIIQLLSKRSGATEEELLEYFNAIKYNKLAVLIKLADRGHNVETLSSMKLEKIHKYTKETRDYIYPLCSYAKRHYPEITNGVTILKSKIVSLTEETETLLSMFEHEKGKEPIHKEQEEVKQTVVDGNDTEKGLDNNGQE